MAAINERHPTSSLDNWYYTVCNSRGDVIAIYDEDKYFFGKYTYDSWGKIVSITDEWGNDISTYDDIVTRNSIRYRGYVYDTETGFYYLNSRYYDPETCRFISADDADLLRGEYEAMSQYSLYAYCFNNPVNLSDDDGDWPSWATKVIIGTAVIAAAGVLTVATAGTGTALACFAVGALKGAVAGAAIGAASGAATGAVSHRITTGCWNGAGNAAINGAADGYMMGAITGFISGGLSSSACFVAGTAVVCSVGTVAIETIKAGDYVWAWDEQTDTVALKQVVEAYVNETNELVHVHVNGEEIICTPTHPFYSPERGWTDAVKLRAGDVLVLVNGEYVVVEFVQHEILETPVKVYNFQVEDYHTYYISDAGVLVHNSCKNPGRTGKQARLREMANDDKLSSALRGEIKRDINMINRGQRTRIRVPSGYDMAHRIGYSAKDGYSYAYTNLQPKSMHWIHHKYFR